jgi:hypothetical protein
MGARGANGGTAIHEVAERMAGYYTCHCFTPFSAGPIISEPLVMTL